MKEVKRYRLFRFRCGYEFSKQENCNFRFASFWNGFLLYKEIRVCWMEKPIFVSYFSFILSPSLSHTPSPVHWMAHGKVVNNKAVHVIFFLWVHSPMMNDLVFDWMAKCLNIYISSDSNLPFEMWWYIFCETTLARSRMQKTFVFMLYGCLSFIFHSINMLIAFILRNSSSLWCVCVYVCLRENCIAFKIVWLWKILKQMAFFVMCVKYPLIDR